jgi:tRNA nucleotidyltransferase (CCA-adding enzyme)
MLAALLSPLPSSETEETCQSRLRLSPSWIARIRRCLERGGALADAAMALDAAQATRLLSAESIETILWASSVRPEARERLETYLKKWRHVKLGVTGNDLIELGYRPGPDFKAAMSEALDMKLSGALPTRERELEFLRERLDASKSRS